MTYNSGGGEVRTLGRLLELYADSNTRLQMLVDTNALQARGRVRKRNRKREGWREERSERQTYRHTDGGREGERECREEENQYYVWCEYEENY